MYIRPESVTVTLNNKMTDLMIGNLTAQERQFYEYQLEAVIKSGESN